MMYLCVRVCVCVCVCMQGRDAQVRLKNHAQTAKDNNQPGLSRLNIGTELVGEETSGTPNQWSRALQYPLTTALKDLVKIPLCSH